MFLSNEKLTESTEYQLLNTVHSNNTSLYVYDNGINDTKSYFSKVFDLLEKNGILIFESHHPQYENDEKFNEIKKNLLTMYTLVKEGTYLNKNFYDKNRRFLLLKKN